MASDGPLPSSPLESMHRRAGATMRVRDGHVVAAHYGSVTTEVSVSIERVGLCDRSDLEQVTVTGAKAELDGMAPDALRGGTAARCVDGVWLCRTQVDRLVAVGVPAAIERIKQSTAGSDLKFHHCHTHCAFELVGSRADHTLETAGLTATLEPLDHVETSLCGTQALVLRETPIRFLILIDAQDAPAAWTMLMQAAREYGGVAVGCEALDLLTASHRRAAV